MPQCWQFTAWLHKVLVTLHYSSLHGLGDSSLQLSTTKNTSSSAIIVLHKPVTAFCVKSFILWMSGPLDQGSALLVAFIIYFTEHKKETSPLWIKSDINPLNTSYPSWKKRPANCTDTPSGFLRESVAAAASGAWGMWLEHACHLLSITSLRGTKTGINIAKFVFYCT